MTIDQFAKNLPALILFLVLGFFWLRAFFTLYHFMRFGIGPAPKRASFVFLVGLIILSGISFAIYSQLDGEQISELIKLLFKKQQLMAQ